MRENKCITRAFLLARGARRGRRVVVVAHRLVLLAFPATAAAEGLVVGTLLLWRARQSPADAGLLLETILLALSPVARIFDALHFLPVLLHQGRVELALQQATRVSPPCVQLPQQLLHSLLTAQLLHITSDITRTNSRTRNPE